jgi:2-(1,2-epoxy-1,2-dihydrophenyl)acetyl-CoA isomerase
VAAVNGVAAGAGAAFALACDFRILADTAGLNLGFAGIGLAVDSGLSWTLPRMVGMAKAKELLLTPRTITAPEALDLGLATQVVGNDILLATADGLAGRLAQGPTVAFGAIRRALAFSAGHGLDESLQFEADLMASTGMTRDHSNAVRSFLGKQPPTFHGR